MATWNVKVLSATTTRILAVAVAVVGAMDLGYPALAGTITQDEIAIYKTVLASWFDGKPRRQLADYHLGGPPSARDSEFLRCTKGLRFAGDIRPDNSQKSLDVADFEGSDIDLTDGWKWTPNDPGQAITNGKSVRTAVSDGIAHSLVSFSQIAFSYDHTDALVKFSMVCGGLCGSGSTIHLHKSNRQWKVVSRCGGWIS